MTTPPSYIILTDATFEAEVLESPLPTLVVFGAAWSGSCHMLAPCLDALAKEYEGRVRIGGLDVEAHPTTARAFGIATIPTLLFFDQGEVVDHLVGAVPGATLRERLNRLREEAPST